MTIKLKTVAIILIILPAIMLSCSSEKPAESNKKVSSNAIAGETAQEKVNTITQWYEAVGTIRPKTETNIEAQATAQIIKILVSPGSTVKKGDSLVLLDNRQFLSRLDRAKEGLKSSQAAKEQAKQALAAAKAGFTQAESEFKRTESYFKSQAATSRELEQAKASWLTAKANVKKAEEGLIETNSGIKQSMELVTQAEIDLEYTVIKATDDGEVLKKMVEPGDIALPGKPLIIMRTSSSLRLEAHVREGLISKIVPGSSLDVEIKTLNRKVSAIIDEIEPYADPATRTFIVKAVLPNIKGLYPGMYGKLLIPAAEEDVVTIPVKTVKIVGQLQLVSVQENGKWKTRYIKTGAIRGDRVEVLSGLNGNETLKLK
jgi:HlyD family secretion protein